MPSGFIYASDDAENPTAINYTVTFVDTTATCSVISYDAFGVAVTGAKNSGTTYAVGTEAATTDTSSGTYLKVSCV